MGKYIHHLMDWIKEAHNRPWANLVYGWIIGMSLGMISLPMIFW